MKSQRNLSSIKSNRLITITILILILVAAWTIISQVPELSSQQSSPLPKAGFTAPDFTLDTLNGGQLTLSELRGKPVVLNLWASWCIPCREEMPAIEKIYQTYNGSLVVIGLNLTSQDSEMDVKAFVQELGLTFPIVLDRDGSVVASYQLLGLPSTFFIDRNGIIRAVIVGGPMSEATIQSNIEDLVRGK